MSQIWGEGTVIAGRYVLGRRLGKGGMGSVYAAEHLALHSAVAVKLIDPAIAGSPDALQRFMREAQASAALRSPHVVQTLDYGVHEGVPFIVMELLEGETLAQRLERSRVLSLEETSKVVTQVARAMSRAHEAGVVHRDLKPDNVFLVRNDDEEIAKVLDFGIAKTTGYHLGGSSQTRTGMLLGTPYYMSPEQVEGNKSLDHRTDLWSIAVIAFECVVGRRPFDGESLGELVLQICTRPIPVPSALAAVPAAFDAWFQRGTQRVPSQRFQSARELAASLRAILDPGRREPLPTDPAIVVAPPSPEGRSTPTTGGAGTLARTVDTPGGSRARFGLLGGALALVIVGTAVALLAGGPEPETPSVEEPALTASETPPAREAPEVEKPTPGPVNDAGPGSTKAEATPSPQPSSEASPAPSTTALAPPRGAKKTSAKAKAKTPASAARPEQQGAAPAAPMPPPSPAPTVDFGF